MSKSFRRNDFAPLPSSSPASGECPPHHRPGRQGSSGRPLGKGSQRRDVHDGSPSTSARVTAQARQKGTPSAQLPIRSTPVRSARRVAQRLALRANSMWNWSSSAGLYSLIRAMTVALACPVRPTPRRRRRRRTLRCGRAPVPHLAADRPAVADGETPRRPETIRGSVADVREPLAMEAIRQEAVPVVVDLVGEERRLGVGSEYPWAV